MERLYYDRITSLDERPRENGPCTVWAWLSEGPRKNTSSQKKKEIDQQINSIYKYDTTISFVQPGDPTKYTKVLKKQGLLHGLLQ